MPGSPCLPRNTLKDYLNGSADDERLAAIESHLSECASCEQTVLELESNPDTLLVSLREQASALKPVKSQAKSESAGESSVIQRALESVKQFPVHSVGPTGPLEKSGKIGLQRIGAYELLGPLGRGGMGLVMLARHATLKKQVAIKILPSLIGDRPELVQRFQREIITAGQLNHPSIVHATDAGAEQGTHYLVMEYIDGLDLSRIARLGGPLPVADACELMRQAALGLSYAHAQGVVHRDVKPSNLMLDTAGRVKILDFGLAQLNLWEDAAVELTTVGQLMGTLDYMAPEQAERVGPVDYRADLYALGATLFRLLTGRAPLAASPNMTLLEKVRMLGSHSAPLVSTLRDDCPVQLVQLIERLLSRDPAARPASAAHVAEAILPLCNGHNLPALLTRCRETAAADTVQAETPALHPLVTSLPPNQPPRRSWLALAWLAPLALCAAIFIVLETQKGLLIIESEVAGVKVNVLQEGKVYQQLQVQPGAQSTRLFADKYAIEIDGASDEVAIDQSSVEIRRGGTVVARIKQKVKAAPAELDLSGIYNSIGVGDVIAKQNQADALSNPPVDRQTASLEVELARAKLDQQQKEVDQLKAEVAQKTYEWEQVQTLFRKGLVSELEHHQKRNSWEQAKSKLEKAEAAMRELAITLSIKENKSLESRVNAADTKNRESSPRVTVAAQPMYAGKTLQEWLDVLERDLDNKTRLETLPALVELASVTDDTVRERINRALVSVINGVARQIQWTSDGIRHRPASLAKGVNPLVGALISINGHEVAFALLKEYCLLTEGQVTPSTFVILYALHNSTRQKEASEALAWEWLVADGRLQSLNAPLAWLAFAYIEDRLTWEDESFYKAFPELIASQPHLGLPALCILKNVSATSLLWHEMEEAIARRTRDGFLAQDASPQLVALTATRLAASSIVDNYRDELVEMLRKRLVALSEDRERLLAAAPRVLAPVPPGVSLTTRPTGQRFSGAFRPFRLESPRENEEPVAPEDQPVGSELASLLVLTVRLNATLELAEPLAAAAAPIFEQAQLVSKSFNGEFQSKVDPLKWPFEQAQLRNLPKQLSEFSPASWRATNLAATFNTLPRPTRPLFGTQLYALILDQYANREMKRDTNGDQRLSKAEYGYQPSIDENGDEVVTKEELLSHFQEKDMREYVTLRFGDIVRFRETSGPPNYLTKQDKDVVSNFSDAQFAEMDTNGDERVTLPELAVYGMKHPKQDASAARVSSNAMPPVARPAENPRRAWAERQIAKYDKNKDGQLTADEWSMMVVRPKEGTDANGDGVITLEEFVNKR